MADIDELSARRDDMLGLLDGLAETLIGDLTAEQAAALASIRARLADERWRVVVCGEFRRGKSSLLNALVDRPGLFPVDSDLTTSVVVTLSWGEQEEAFVYFAPGPGGGGPKPITLDEVGLYVTEQANPDNALRVERVEMTAPLDLLRSGLVLVDTPGLGSVQPAHSAATWAYLTDESADAVIFTLSAVEPAGVLELDFFERAIGLCEAFVTAVTMTDRVVEPDADAVIRAARERLAARAQCGPEDLVVVGVSALRAFAALERGDERLLAASGFPRLRHELGSGLLRACVAGRLHACLDAVEHLVAAAAAPAENELAGHLDGTIRGRLEAELDETGERLRELGSAGNRWRRDLAAQIDLAARPVRARFAEDAAAIRERFLRAVGGSAPLDPNAVCAQVTGDLVAAAGRGSRALAKAVDTVARRHTALTTFPLTGVDTGESVPARIRVPAVRPASDRAVGPSRFAAYRTIWVGGRLAGPAGATVGALVGALGGVPGMVLGALVGGAVGQVWGWLAGRDEVRGQVAEGRRRETAAALRDQILPLIDATRAGFDRDLADRVRDVTRLLTDALDTHLETQAASLRASLRGLARTRDTDERDRPARIAELAAVLGRFAAAQDEIDLRRDRVDAGQGADSGTDTDSDSDTDSGTGTDTDTETTAEPVGGEGGQ